MSSELTPELRAFFDLLQEGVIVLDHAQNRLYSNPAGEAFLTRYQGDFLENETRFSVKPLGALKLVLIHDDQKFQLQESFHLQSLGMIVTEIGHEIKNALSAVSGAAWLIRQMLTENQVPRENILKKLGYIEETVDRVDQIIKSVKSVAQGGYVGDPTTITLREVIDDAKLMLGPKLDAKKIHLTIDDPSNLLSTTFLGRRLQLSQVFINLFSNALDVHEETGAGEIKLKLGQEAGELCCEVSDSGKGIPSDLHGRLFTPFFTTKSQGHGTGLGLSISRTIMRKNGGDLRFKPAVSTNCFEVRIPLKTT